MEIELFAEPSCPFTWIVAGWLRSATATTGDHLVVRPLSLGILNADDDGVPEVYARQQRAGQRALRVMEAIRSEVDADTATAFFFEAGARFHLEGDTGFERLAEAVAASGAPAPVLVAADDPSGDAHLAAELEAAAAALGEPSGSPVVSFPALGRAFWGPILQSVPEPDAAVALLSAVAGLAAVPEFGQLKAPIGELALS